MEKFIRKKKCKPKSTRTDEIVARVIQVMHTYTISEKLIEQNITVELKPTT